MGVRYAGTVGAPALDGVSFGIEAGHVVGLLGPNGSGKSTLFRVLATLLPPTSGSARIFGRDVRRDPLSARRSIGVVFQSPALDKELTARENLLYHGRMLGLERAGLRRRADELLDAVDLAGAARTIAKRLSGGMRRRVEIAKALLAAPPLLLMDEPTVGLDPAARRQTWKLLHDLRESGAAGTVLVSTHLMDDLGPDAADCGRVILLNAGKVVADDSPDALTRRAAGEVVTLVPEQIGDLDALSDRVAGMPGVGADDVTRRASSLRVDIADGRSLATALLADPSVTLREVTVGRATMDDVFLRLTGRGLTDGTPA